MTSVVDVLPRARGPLSEAILESLCRDERGDFPELREAGEADPFGEDVQLALFLCYELHHQGFPGVDDDWEWDPELLRLRAAMERVFLAGLRSCTAGGGDVRRELDELVVEPIDGIGVSQFLAARGERWHLREYLTLRSLQHLRTVDPLTRPVPRSPGQRYGRLMSAAGLRPDPQWYLGEIPAPMLAVVNLRSLFALHRRLRGALAGCLASAEATAGPEALLMERALRRLRVPGQVTVRESAVRHDLIGELLAAEPSLAADVVFGVQAANLLEAQFAAHVLAAWHMETSALG